MKRLFFMLIGAVIASMCVCVIGVIIGIIIAASVTPIVTGVVIGVVFIIVSIVFSIVFEVVAVCGLTWWTKRSVNTSLGMVDRMKMTLELVLPLIHTTKVNEMGFSIRIRQ